MSEITDKRALHSFWETHGFSTSILDPTDFKRIHQHDEVELQIIENASCSMIIGHQRCLFPQGQLVVRWGAIPHGALVVHQGTPMSYCLHLPTAWFIDWGLSSHLVDAVLMGTQIEAPIETQPCSDVALIKHWDALLVDGDEEAREIVLLEVQARLKRIDRSLNQARMRGEDSKRLPEDLFPATAFEKMVVKIARDHCTEISIQDIAKAASISESHAMALFRKHSGITIHEYLTRYRISTAQRLLACTSQKITVLARECGFISPARFHIAFKKICGMTPRHYRNTVLSTPRRNSGKAAPRRGSGVTP